MTLLCLGGTSSVKPGIGAAVSFGAGYVASKFLSSGNGYAAIFAGFLGLLTYETGTLCSSDPPAVPTLTAADYYNLVQFSDMDATIASLGKFKDWFANLIWPDVCACDSGTIPTPPAPLAAPTNLINVTNIISGTGPVGPCDTRSGGPVAIGTYGGVAEQEIIPTSAQTGDLVGAPNIALPSGATSIVWTGTVTPAGGSHQTIQFELQWLNASNVDISEVDLVVASGATGTATSTPPAGAARWLIRAISWTGIPSSDLVSATASVFCGNTSSSVQSPCCPADQLQLAKLEQILQMVTLIQRQAVPFSYVHGAAHAGLSGTGTIAVSSLLGLSIHLSTVPVGAPSSLAEPTYLYAAGWWNVGTADGWIHDQRVTAVDQIWLPPDMSAMTVVGYALGAGFVATITELVREP